MFLSQQWLRRTRIPPARVLSAKPFEIRTRPAIDSAARKKRLSLTIIASAFSSFIAISVVPPYFLTGHDVDVPEAGHNPEKKKNEEEPWVGAEPFVELEADENAYCDGDYDRNANRGERPQGLEQLSFFLTCCHKYLSKLPVSKEQNLNFITHTRYGCQQGFPKSVTVLQLLETSSGSGYCPVEVLGRVCNRDKTGFEL